MIAVLQRLTCVGLAGAILGVGCTPVQTQHPVALVPTSSVVDEVPTRDACPILALPPSTKGIREKDTVVVQFVLDTTARPTDGTMKIVSTTNPLLNSTALRFVSRCHYTPARKSGHAVAVVIQQPVMF